MHYVHSATSCEREDTAAGRDRSRRTFRGWWSSATWRRRETTACERDPRPSTASSASTRLLRLHCCLSTHLPAAGGGGGGGAVQVGRTVDGSLWFSRQSLPQTNNTTRHVCLTKIKWRIQLVSRHPPYCLVPFFEKNIFWKHVVSRYGF